VGKDIPVELRREREWRREFSSALKLGHMQGSAIPNIATTIAITPTIASTDKLWYLIAESVMSSCFFLCSVGKAQVVIIRLANESVRRRDKGMMSMTEQSRVNGMFER